MKKIFQTFISCVLFFVFFGSVSAQECNFPVRKTTADEIVAKISECQEARKTNKTAQIEDFSCPAGEFALEDGLPLTDERLAYHIAVNILMNEADESIKKYMQSLQKNRSKDALAWQENIRACIHGSPTNPGKSVKEIYREICNYPAMVEFLNNNSTKKAVISTTTSLPQSACDELVKRKITAWEKLGNNLMISGMNKSFQNDRSRFMDAVQGKYRAILEKFHDYQKIIFRASSKV